MRRIYTAAAITAFTMIVGSASWSLGDNPIINEGSIGDCSIDAFDGGRNSYVKISSSQAQIDRATVSDFGGLDTWRKDAEYIESVCNLDAGSVTLINPMSSKPEYQGSEYHTTTEGYGLYYDDGITSTFYGIGDPPASAVNVALTASPASGAANEFTVTALFGEGVIGFTASDVTVTNGTVSEFSGNGNEYSFVVTPSADGAVTVNIAAEAATAVSDSDIKSAAAAQLSLTGDVTAPFGYFVSLDQDTINTGNDEAVSFTFAGAEVGTTYSYKFSSSGGGTPVTGGGTISTATDQITGIDVSGLGDGTLTLDVVLTDAAGNRGDTTTDTATKDATAPTGHSVAFTQSGVNASNEAAIGFTISNAEDVDYSYTISSNGGGTDVTGSGTISGGSETVTGLDLSGLEDGTLTLSVVLTDAAGNAAAAVEANVSKDGLAPEGPPAPTLADGSNSGSTTDTLTNDATPTIEGTAEANATVTVYVGKTEAGTTSADGSGDWSFTFAEGGLAAGENAVTVTATDVAGNTSSASDALVITLDTGAPAVTLTGPTDVVTEDFTVTFTFSENVTGFEASDVTVSNGSKGTFFGSNDVYTLVITNPILGTIVTVSVDANQAFDAAGNGNEASNVFEVQAGSPASEFEKYREDIQQVLVEEASRSLRSSVAANRRLAQSARDRFIEFGQTQAREEEVTRALIPFDVDGNFTLSETGLSTAGNFFQQVGNAEGTYRRIFFGDFDVQHDNDTDSTTATLTGRMAWEQMTSEQTMLGYFIGGELATSTIGGSFEGDQDRIGVTAGGYVVHELAEQVYFDGFASVGAGRNNLEMANDTLALESEYTTQTATLGGAITGVYSQKGYDFKPELALSFGKTWLGDIGFTGRAYGLVDNTLSLDAGYVSIASFTFRPEVIIPIGADFVADTNTQLSFAPRLVCEQIKSTTKTSDCGTGGELGFSSTSEDGLSSAGMRVLLDRINGGTRSSFAFSVEHKF